MDCKKREELTGDYLTGGLETGKKAEFEEHLNACAACKGELELFSRTWELMDAYKTPELSGDFTPSLMRRIRAEGSAEEPENGLGQWWKVPAMTLASCAIYLLCVETAILPSRDGAPNSPATEGSVTLADMLKEGRDSGGLDLLELVAKGGGK